MDKYIFTIPLMKGVKKAFEINNEKGLTIAKVLRFYPNFLNILTEIFLTGWEVNIKATEGDKEFLIREHFRWTKNEWSIFENGLKIGTLTNIKAIEFGDTKEIVIQGENYYYLDKPLETKTFIQDENKNVIAIVDYKLFDLSRKKEIVLYSNEIAMK
ncbi:tubby C-terminal domain-like protein [Sporosarcina sp. FSL K6-3457]|uniref:tubby C-terminal domain-like protein n=1 Tax=Sporosarcina sp. FSL K6-3457 TaxID=2978204 RepID=UPI0030F8F9AD